MVANPLALVLLFLLTTLITACDCDHKCQDNCIRNDQQANQIAQRWLNAFATGGIDTLPQAVTNDIHIYDEGATNGSITPETTNINDLHTIIAAGPYGGNGVTDVTYNVVFTFHNCDHIALRWQQNVITTDMIGYGSTLPAGKKVNFRGSDLLTIDLASKKVMNATTSSDLLNYYRALDYHLGVWNATADTFFGS